MVFPIVRQRFLKRSIPSTSSQCTLRFNRFTFFAFGTPSRPFDFFSGASSCVSESSAAVSLFASCSSEGRPYSPCRLPEDELGDECVGRRPDLAASVPVSSLAPCQAELTESSTSSIDARLPFSVSDLMGSFVVSLVHALQQSSLRSCFLHMSVCLCSTGFSCPLCVGSRAGATSCVLQYSAKSERKMWQCRRFPQLSVFSCRARAAANYLAMSVIPDDELGLSNVLARQPDFASHAKQNWLNHCTSSK